MVYKPKKKVNGHKKNDRYTRRRKARDARKRRAASLPVRSNIKRYVAEQLDKTHPDNRYTFSVTTPTTQIKPHYNWGSFTPIYPFGCTFQEKFLRMEVQRLRPVLKTGQADAFVDLLGPIDEIGHVPKVDVDMEGPEDSKQTHTDIGHRAMKTVSQKNHWKSIIGRGIHMKSSSIYGTIFLNPSMIYELQHSDLKLHMFVLEDKKVTKDSFLAWWTDALDRVRDGSAFNPPVANQTGRTAKSEDARTNDFKSDHLNVPYRSGASYLHQTANKVACADGTDDKGGEDEVLVDWRKFYEETSDNPLHSLFFNEIKCGHKWDGSADAANLPFNRSRFVVHEHKTWSFKPNSAGVVKSCVPFEYSFPDHYMTYEKQLLDQPYVYRKANSSDDSNSGIHWSRMCPRKQPFVVFVYTRSNYNRTKIDGPDVKLDTSSRSAPALPPFEGVDSNGIMISNLYPSFNSDGTSTKNTAARVGADDVFHIDMNFKCHYENPLANGQVPTINKGRPIIHKRESAPARKPPPKRDAPMDPISRKYMKTLKDDFKVVKPPRGDLKRGAPFFGPGGKKSKTYIGTDGNRYHISDSPPPQLRNAKRGAPFTGPDGKKSKISLSNIISDAWQGIKSHPLVVAEVIGFGATLVLAPELAPMIGRVFSTFGPAAARQFAQGSILRGIGQKASMQGYQRLAQLAGAGEGYFVPAGTELAEVYEAEHAAAGFVRGLPVRPSRASASYGLGRHGLIDQTADVARFNAKLSRNWTRNQLRDVLVE